MRNRQRVAGYYFVTDAVLSRAGNLSDVRGAQSAGVGVVQYRAKQGSSRALYHEALALRSICREALFLVNDRLDLALAVGADGVHLGQEDLPCLIARRLLGPDKVVGVSVRSAAEAREAERDGADYVGVSPVFSTQTKADAGAPAGLEAVREVRRAVTLPVVAIGGIDLDNAAEVIRAGADSVCAISAVVCASDVEAEIRKFQGLFRASAP
ncbi:MAG TPA: thiamine phosphate synthase [Anaeromyxobacteraceae bacterium]|nr:thiamine phosphate synthase [Anaeromyxobacteraceae bacterium]